jgi:amino-acid N-acetyltransferase
VKLFFVSLGPGLRAQAYKLPEGIELGEDGRVIRLTPAQAEAVLRFNSAGLAGEAGRIRPPNRPLEELALALKASRAGVERVHLINGREDGAILRELFSNLGSGAMLYSDEYDAIRPLRSRDIPVILRLMDPLMRQGILVRRSAEQILEKKEDFAVFEIDGSVHACGALHEWEGQGEIAAIATDPLYADLGMGRRLVGYLISQARKRGLSKVFVLTTRTQDWFELLGFTEAGVESLPESRRRLYDRGRRSKVFALDLT